MPRHHLVPRMYLKHFANADEKLVMVRRDDLAVARQTSVTAACREAGFYAIPTEDIEPEARDGHDPEAVEKALASIEGATTPLLAAILGTNVVPQLEDFDRYQVAQFVALQATRTWAFRRDFVELAQLSAKRQLEAFTTDEQIRKFLKKTGKPARPNDIGEFRARALGPDGPKLRVPNSVSTQAAVQFALTTGQEEIFTRAWHLRVFDEPALLTSDAPVVFHRSGPPGTPLPGIATADAIYFPVDRYHLLSFERTSGLADDKVILNANPGRAAVVNRLVAGQAERWIYHHPDDSQLLDDIQLADRPEFVTETVQMSTNTDEVRVRKRVVRRKA